MLKGFAEIKEARQQGGERDKFAKLNLRDYDGSTKTIRIVGPVYPMGQHWVKRRAKDGTVKQFPALCANYDPKTDSFHDNGCPYCKAHISFNKRYYANCIDRDEVENEPKRLPEHTKSENKGIESEDYGFKVHFKDADSKSWTPVKVISFPTGVGRDIGALEKTKNAKVSKKTGKKVVFPVGHAKYGFDIDVLYEASRKAKAWTIEFAESTPLSEEELAYLYWDLSTSQWLKPVDVEAAIEDFNKVKDSIIFPESEDSDEDESALPANQKKAKKKASELEDDDEEEDEDDEPVSKKKKAKKKVEIEDEDEEEDDIDASDDEDEEDDDDEPVSKKKKKQIEEDDEEDDDDTDDEDEEEDDDDTDDDNSDEDDELDF